PEAGDGLLGLRPARPVAVQAVFRAEETDGRRSPRASGFPAERAAARVAGDPPRPPADRTLGLQGSVPLLAVDLAVAALHRDVGLPHGARRAEAAALAERTLEDLPAALAGAAGDPPVLAARDGALRVRPGLALAALAHGDAAPRTGRTGRVLEDPLAVAVAALDARVRAPDGARRAGAPGALADIARQV